MNQLVRIGIVLSTILATASVSISESHSIKVNSDQSQVKWLGKKVTGEHFGTVKVTSGEIVLDKTEEGEKIVSGNFEVGLATIANQDIESAEWKAKLENHLKSEDFFNVGKFPVASFKITSSEGMIENGKGKVQLKGELSIKGIVGEVEFPAEIEVKEGSYSAKAKLTIDRTKWDIRYNSGRFFDPGNLGDKLIYDDISLELKVVAK